MANGAYNLVSAWGDKGECEKAQGVFEKLERLASKYGEAQPEIRVALAKGAYNLGLAYELAGRADRACEMYEVAAQVGYESGSEEAARRAMGQAKGLGCRWYEKL